MTNFWMMGRRAVQFAIICGAVIALSPPALCRADDKPPAAATSFSEILDAQTLASLRAVGDYVKNHSQAPDVEDAYQWLFATAAEYGMEEDVVSLAEDYLKRPAEGQSSRAGASKVLGIGLAKGGKLAEAMAAFDAHLKEVDIRDPGLSIDYGTLLVEYAQLEGNFKVARSVYDSLSSALYLNQNVRAFCENRAGHLELGKKAAPKIGTTDLEGKAIDLSQYAGKVVLVDFWATDCVPCVEQFPEMKDLYDEFHGKGLEIVGISLDTEKSAVDAFQADYKLPWRLSLSSTDKDATRRSYRSDKIPTMYLVDQKGNIAYVDLRHDRLRLAVEKLLGTGK